jgi:hypothetical protein
MKVKTLKMLAEELQVIEAELKDNEADQAATLVHQAINKVALVIMRLDFEKYKKVG